MSSAREMLSMQVAASTQMFASFRLGDMELAISIEALQEVVNLPEKFTKVPLGPDYLRGLFNLRGAVVPVVDMSCLLSAESGMQDDQKKVAIILAQSVRIGLLFDATSEILTVHQEDISWIDQSVNASRNSVVRGVLKLDDGNRIVEVIDPLLLLRIENIPQVLQQAEKEASESLRKKTRRSQCISFRTGDLDFGLKIAAISEIIRVPEIKRSVLTVDHCIGMVNLRGKIIPIIDFHMFLRVEGEKSADLDAQRIIILKIETIQVGFLVDRVDSIVTYFEEDLLPIPLFNQEKVEMMKELLPRDNANNVILLNESRILSSEDVVQITKGHDSLYGSKSGKHEAKQGPSSDRRPYLAFKMEYLLSARLSSVDEIAKMSEDLVKAPGYPDYVAGMLTMRGEVVMVIDLRVYYGLKPLADRSNSRILIVRGEKSKFGLVVDEVDSIATLDEGNKVRMPDIFAPNAKAVLQGDMKEVVEMTESSGKKSTLMLFDVESFIRKIEAREVPAAEGF